MAPIIEDADLGIVPKRTDGFGNEAFSTKVLEFMAMGVPVVVSDSAVDRYYFTDRVVTFFKGNDEAHLAECVLEMIQDTAKREAQVKRADDFVRTFDWEAPKERILGVGGYFGSVGQGRRKPCRRRLQMTGDRQRWLAGDRIPPWR